jgi:putative membrane protein
MLYLFAKWLHIVAVISWMAGLLYLYRLLIYLAERGENKDNHALLCLMARRLYKVITIPAMIVAVLAGFSMVGMQPAIGASGWFMVKFVAVLGMLHFTVKGGRLVGRFEQRSPKVPTSRALRIMNEIPTILMLIIVAMVVFKPF